MCLTGPPGPRKSTSTGILESPNYTGLDPREGVFGNIDETQSTGCERFHPGAQDVLQKKRRTRITGSNDHPSRRLTTYPDPPQSSLLPCGFVSIACTHAGLLTEYYSTCISYSPLYHHRSIWCKIGTGHASLEFVHIFPKGC